MSGIIVPVSAVRTGLIWDENHDWLGWDQGEE
jgi:hypothetical protein